MHAWTSDTTGLLRVSQRKITDPGHFCAAVAWAGKAPRRYPIVPFLAVRYFGYLLLALVAGIALTEAGLRYLASQGTVVSADWVAENAAINLLNSQKVLSSPEDPVWQSRGIPLAARQMGISRILVIGDSFVWGDGYLNANDIWWRQLQRELQHRGYFGVEVVAAGLNGASTQQQLQWLTEIDLARRLRADAVVLGYVTNDPDVQGADGQYLVRQIGRDLPQPTWAGLDATFGRVLPTLTAQIKPLLTKKWASELEGAYLYSDWEREILKAPSIEAYREVVLSLGEVAHALDLPFYVVTLPGAPSAETFGPLYQPIEPLFAEAEIPFVNLLNDFADTYTTQPGAGVSSLLHWGINPANGHPGVRATRFYARKVADLLEGTAPAVLGPRYPEPPVLRPRINDWMPPAAAVEEVAPGHWRVTYPGSHDLAPRQPVGEPHVMLAFELPVAIRKLTLSGDQLRGARLWFTAVDGSSGVDLGHPLGGEAREGARISWDLTPDPAAGAINTLRLAADLNDAKLSRRVTFSAASLEHRKGYAFAFPLPQLSGEADDEAHPARSPWLLLENGVPLHPAHAQHAGIVAEGAGRWSHWKDAVIFSASDYTDPRRSGYRYELVQYESEGNVIDLEIDFDEPAVRP